jgi:putative transcriptional regulator
VALIAMLVAIPAPARVTPGAPAAGPAAGMLLVARRDLPSRYFAHTVILLIRHGATGTLGVIVNRRSRFDLQDLLPDFAGAPTVRYPLFVGGPVGPDRILMLMRRTAPGGGVERVTDDILFSAERTVLEALVEAGKPASELHLYAGHAGWVGGQLDAELARGDWRLVPATADDVFGDDADELWERLIDRLDPPGIRVQRPAPGRDSVARASGRVHPGRAPAAQTSPARRAPAPGTTATAPAA